jgi:hypothetical protein
LAVSGVFFNTLSVGGMHGRSMRVMPLCLWGVCTRLGDFLKPQSKGGFGAYGEHQ